MNTKTRIIKTKDFKISDNLDKRLELIEKNVIENKELVKLVRELAKK